MKLRPEKESGLHKTSTLYLCDIGATLYQLSLKANWELTIMLVSNKPVKYKYMKIIYVNCGERNEYA